MATKTQCKLCMGEGREWYTGNGESWSEECPQCLGSGQWSPCQNCFEDPVDEKDGSYCAECAALFEVESERLHELAHAPGRF